MSSSDDIRDFRASLFQSSAARSARRIASLKRDVELLERITDLDAAMEGFSKTQMQPIQLQRSVLNVPHKVSDTETYMIDLCSLKAMPQSIHNSTSWFVTGSLDGCVAVWDGAAGRRKPVCYDRLHSVGQLGRVEDIAVIPPSATTHQAAMFFTVSKHRDTITHWNTREVPPTATDAEGSTAQRYVLSRRECDMESNIHSLNRLATDSTGHSLAATMTLRDPKRDVAVGVWDLRSIAEGGSARPLCSITGLSEGRQLHSIAFHPDGSLLSVGDGAGRCSSFDLRSGKFAFTTACAPHVFGGVSCIAWASCGIRLATGGTDGLVQLWDARRLYDAASRGTSSDREVAPFRIAAHCDWVTSLSFSPHRTVSPTLSLEAMPLTLVSTSVDGKIKFWDTLRCGQVLHSLEHVADGGVSHAVRSHCWLASGEMVSIAAHTKSWTVWGTQSFAADMFEESDDDVIVAHPAQAERLGDSEAESDEDEDEDEASRKRPANNDPSASDSEEEDDMAALRMKR